MNIGNHSRLTAVLRFSDIFDEEPASVDEYLVNVPKKILLHFSSHLLSLFSKNSHFNSNVRSFVKQFFSDANGDFRDLVLDRITNKYIERPETQISIVNNVASLEFFRYSLMSTNEADDISEEDKPQSEIDIFKAYLLINQILDQFQTANLKKLDELDTNDKVRRFMMLISLPDYDLLNNDDLNIVFLCQLVKANWLFEFFESSPIYEPLLSALYETFKFENKGDIFTFLTTMGHFCLERNEGSITININGHENFDIVEHHFDKFCIENVNKDNDFLEIRENPLYKEGKGVYRVIIPYFMIEKLYKSWYFTINKVNANMPNPIVLPNDFRSHYGQHFTEDFMIKRALNGIFSSKSKIFSGLDIRSSFKDIVSEPDFYVRESRTIFLFETKETFLNAKNKVSYDYDLIEDDLKSKLYFKVNNKGKVVPKAVLQLISNIRRIKENAIVFETYTSLNKITIYPIIILHDESFNAPSINFIVNEWFQTELVNLKNSGIDIRRVNPVVIITMDTIILINDTLSKRGYSLDKLLKIYGENYLTGTRSSDLSKTFMSFSKFVTNYFQRENIRLLPKREWLNASIKNLLAENSM